MLSSRKVNTLKSDFLKLAKLAHLDMTKDDLSVEKQRAPHKPPARLPEGKMAVYVFLHKGNTLKVGKVGLRSRARYTSQHYNPESSNSNLAKSIISKPEAVGLRRPLSTREVGPWIKKNTHRINFLLDANCGMPALALLESFLQCRLKPIFEGFKSQMQSMDGKT